MFYELINSFYVLQEENRTHPPLHEVAIGYMSSKDDSHLAWRSKRHGHPSEVQEWADHARAILSKTGAMGKEMASEIHVISGRLNLEDLNAVVRDPATIQDLVKKAFARTREVDMKSIKIDGIAINQKYSHG